jgi:hypothetical protein
MQVSSKNLRLGTQSKLQFIEDCFQPKIKWLIKRRNPKVFSIPIGWPDPLFLSSKL